MSSRAPRIRLGNPLPGTVLRMFLDGHSIDQIAYDHSDSEGEGVVLSIDIERALRRSVMSLKRKRRSKP